MEAVGYCLLRSSPLTGTVRLPSPRPLAVEMRLTKAGSPLAGVQVDTA